MRDIPPGMRRNRPTDIGREAGKHIAIFCDQEEQKKMTLRPRCTTCAFRAETIPNGCEGTVMDALKCCFEDIPFMCHESKSGQVCAGWLMMRSKKSFKVEWPFSYEENPPHSASQGRKK